MLRRSGPWLLVFAIACGDDGTAGSGAPGSSTTDTSSTSSTPSTTDASSGIDETASTGAQACPSGREASTFTEVDGCGEPIGEPLCSEGGQHIDPPTPIEWGHNPPHSGPHDPMWANWGEYEQTLPRRNWVHNLEHGGIVLSYVCGDGCESEVEVLREVMNQRPDLRIIVTPDPELPDVRFAAISWTWVYRFDEPDLDTLLCFVDQHENHAPEDVP